MTSWHRERQDALRFVASCAAGCASLSRPTACDRLEAALAQADATRARLLEAVLHEALAPAAGPAEEVVA
ncbi:hypothetical protein ABC977_04095 [Thioalkalicoccus limnaeus]|uniref:Uncharacterized protein n=1 Tax=Thioalkalicoccus limnaeus TaxID=120681 RepID=A0ABV4BAV3_9GAMM